MASRTRRSWWLGLFFAVLGGCTRYTLLTPQQIETRGTRTFPQAAPPAALDATAAALATLGYRVTVKDPAVGLVKTSPMTILTTAEGETTKHPIFNEHQTEVVVTEDGLAWSVRIEAVGAGTRIRATPRAFRNGEELTGEGLFAAEVLDGRFAALWRELGDVLGPPQP